MTPSKFFLIAFALAGALVQTAFATGANAANEGLLGPFWHGQAHFEQIGNLDWRRPPYNSPSETSPWIAVSGGKWYIFSRIQPAGPKSPNCPGDYREIGVRESADQGKTWSDPVHAVTVDSSRPVDACAILDGSSYYDAPTNTWHILAQCLAAHNAGGWMICHYTRVAASPMGPFQPDPANPVVRNGQLWKAICSGPNKGCNPMATADEGTPDIVEKRGGYYYVTFHGWDPKDDRGVRGVAKTADFRHFITAAPDLPNDAMITAANCQAANPGCIGMGESSTLFTGDYQYMIGETPNLSLICVPNQNWVYSLFRAPRGSFPSWRAGWESYPGNPVIVPSWGSQKCGTQYARLFSDRGGVYLIYEDIGPNRAFTERRLMKLVPGGGPHMVLAHPTSEPPFVHPQR